MALTATFAADFNQFERSLQTATLKLQTFDRATKNSVRGLNKEVESFSGQKLAVEAARMVEAVNRIGGVAKLTDAEVRKLSFTLAEAAQKAGRLGETLAPSIAKMRVELEKLPKPSAESVKTISGLSEAMQSLAGRAGAAGPVLQGVLAGGVAAVGVAAISAGAALASMAVNGLGELISRGSKVAGMREGFVALAGGVDKAGERMESMRAGTRGLVSDLDIMQASNKATLLGLGLNADQMGELAKTAQVLGRAMGLDATSSLNDLITALGRSSPLILDNLGLTVKVGDANEKYAEQLGKTVDALTEAEKKQAFMNAAMQAADERVKDLGDGTLTMGERWTQVKTAIGNATDALGEWLAKSERFNAVADDTVLTLELWQTLFKEGAEKTLEKYRKAIGEIPPEIKKFAGSLDFLMPKVKGVALEMDEMSRIEAKLTDSAKDSIKGHQEAAKALDDRAKKAREFYNWLGEREIQQVSDEMALIEKQKAAWRDYYNWLGQRRMEDDAARLAGMQPIGNPLSTGGAGGFNGTGPWMLRGTVPMNSPNAGGGGFLNFLKNNQIIGAGLGALTGLIPGLSGVGSSIGGGFGGAIGGIGGVAKALGSFAGLLGPIGGIAGGLIGKLFGPSEASKTRKARGGFIENFGGMDALSKAAQNAGFSIDKLMNTRKTKDFEAEVKKLEKALELQKGKDALSKIHGGLEMLEKKAIAIGINPNSILNAKTLEELGNAADEFAQRLEDVNDEFNPLLQSAEDLGIRLPQAILDSLAGMADLGVLTGANADAIRRLASATEVDWKKAQEAAERYGITLESLGQGVNQGRLSAGAQQVINDFDLLTRAGGDVGGILTGMADEISAMVQEAMRLGVSLPENMKPWIEELRRAGMLVDENGEQLQDLGSLRFGDRVKTEFEKITEALEKLIDSLNVMSDAIRNIPSPRMPGFTEGPLPGTPGGSELLPSKDSGALFGGGGGGVRVMQPVNVQMNGDTLLRFTLDNLGPYAKARL